MVMSLTMATVSSVNDVLLRVQYWGKLICHFCTILKGKNILKDYLFLIKKNNDNIKR